MAKWLALCNGGPNDVTVGKECTSLGKACGTLETMMKALHATIGQIQQDPGGQKAVESDYFVATEKDAGRLP